MKLGLDYHGVIDKAPYLFRIMADRVKAFGGEVHIISGAPFTTEFETELRSYHGLGEQWWTHHYSINDDLCERGVPYTIEEANGHKRFPDEIWNHAKGEYCAKHDINLHVDDQQLYLNLFETPVFRYVHDQHYALMHTLIDGMYVQDQAVESFNTISGLLRQ